MKPHYFKMTKDRGKPLNHSLKEKNFHHAVLSQFALEANTLFACNLFERETSGLMLKTTYFNGCEAFYDDGPIASYKKTGGAVTLYQGNHGSMKLVFQLTLSQFSALQNYFSPWFSELLKDHSFCSSQCEATYPKWAVLPMLRISPAGYKMTLRFNAQPTTSFIQAMLNVMAFMGYPLKGCNQVNASMARTQYLKRSLVALSEMEGASPA